VIFGAVLRHTGERLDAHLVGAALVALHVILLIARVARSHGDQPALLRPAYGLGLLLVAQLLLGAISYVGKFTILLRLPMDLLVLVTTTHLIAGALMLAAGVVITLRAFRFSTPAKTALVGKALREQYSV